MVFTLILFTLMVPFLVLLIDPFIQGRNSNNGSFGLATLRKDHVRIGMEILSPGATVLTVFAGRPPEYPAPMERWDSVCGFVEGDEAGLDDLAVVEGERAVVVGEERATDDRGAVALPRVLAEVDQLGHTAVGATNA